MDWAVIQCLCKLMSNGFAYPVLKKEGNKLILLYAWDAKGNLIYVRGRN